MSERGKRVFRFLLDPERDADVIGRIEARPSMTGYVRELVRRDMHEREMHDERLDFAALKASELQAENAKLRNQLEEQKCFAADLEKDVKALRELVRDMMRFFEDGDYCTICEKAAECESLEEYESDCLMRGVFKRRMAEPGIEVDE